MNLSRTSVSINNQLLPKMGKDKGLFFLPPLGVGHVPDGLYVFAGIFWRKEKRGVGEGWRKGCPRGRRKSTFPFPRFLLNPRT